MERESLDDQLKQIEKEKELFKAKIELSKIKSKLSSDFDHLL